MRLLLPTGSATAGLVRKAAEGLDADVVVTGEVASFLTPAALAALVRLGSYDLVIVSGMCTASFEPVERETGVPVYRGPRHAADLPLVLPLIGKVELSRTVPADEIIARKKARAAMQEIARKEEEASFDLLVRGVKIGGTSRMKVLAEIMDAHLREDLPAEAGRLFSAGADIVDLGFGFDATPGDVARCFAALADVQGPLAVDSQDPALIRAALPRADLILSLQEKNIPIVGREIADSGSAAVVIPGQRSLAENLEAAGKAGIGALIADPVLPPAGSGFTEALERFRDHGHPLFFGAGNIVELLDADSVGQNALLAGIAMELGASVIFTSEHSDKTRGSVGEMRRATEMMVLARDRPYPKDLGIDLLVLKEKRRRREPPLAFGSSEQAVAVPKEVVYDPKGNFRIGIEGEEIVAVHEGMAIRGRHWEDVLFTILSEGRVSRLDHAGYLGKELYKAYLAIRFGRSFEQDGEF